MSGDTLARGGKRATFAATGNPNGLSAEEYAERVGAPAPEAQVSSAEPAPSNLIDNSALFRKKKPSITYKGRPLGDMVLVRRIEKTSNSMIVLPDSAQAKSDMGVVVGVGQGSTDITTGKRTPMSVQEGDLVLFDKFASVGMEVSLLNADGEEQEHLILREHDILLCLEEVKQPVGLTQ